MDKKKPIQDSIEETARHLPLGQLFYLLYNNGFQVKPDDYIEMLRITERFGSHDIDETAQWICPIIATSEAEQLKFYHVIEQYKKLNAVQAFDDRAIIKPLSRRIKMLLGVLVLCLLLLTVYLSWPRRIFHLQETNKERIIEKGEPLSFDAFSLLQNRPEDTANIQFAWHFDDSSRAEGLRVKHIFKKPGDYLVRRKISSRKLSLPKNADSLLVHVCEDLPKLHINVPEEALTAQQPYSITAGVDAEPGTVTYYEWTIKDSVFTTQVPIAQNIVFAAEGDYAVTCKAVVGTVNAYCTVTDNQILRVLDNGLHYNANFSASRPGLYIGKTSLKWWVTLAFLLPAAACLFYSLFKRKKKPSALLPPAPAKNMQFRGPYDIPFEQNDIKLVQEERDLQRTFTQMRYKAEEEATIINVPATINSIIRSGGSPQLVFAPLTQQQQYLVLIDRANPKSMLTRLFGYLVKRLAEDGIPVTAFYYDKNFVCSNDSFPGGLSLQRLAETYSNATLIILGRAHELVYSIYPLVEERFLKELNRWQNKAIITPVPVKDWLSKEKVLQKYFILLPADTASLQKLIPALREKIKPQTSLLEITASEQYSLRQTDFQDVAELKQYLNNEEHLFQWLCAICVYPRLRWELVVEMGKVILEKYGSPQKLNYSNLLKLCRITWMQQGVFPQITRLELLKELKFENEIIAREQLLRMLQYSTGMYGEEGYFFEEEKKRQQLTNQFILHASDNNQYNQYAGSRDAFKKLWKKDGILDVPLKKYLDKTNDDKWQTPVKDGLKSVGLSAYFDLQDTMQHKTVRIKKGLAAALAVLLIGLWAYIGFGGGAEKLAPIITLSQDPVTGVLPVTIKVIKDFGRCGDSLKNSFDKLSGYLEINNERTTLVYDQNTARVSFTVPYKNINTGKANIKLEWDNDKSIITTIIYDKQHLPDTVTIDCISSNTYTKKPLYIRYNDTAGYREIENTLGYALYRYNVSALQADFTDSSRIVYYEPNQKARADSIVQIMKQSLGIAVKEEFISEIRTPAAPPILFLNTGRVAVADEPLPDTATGYEYHLLGDQYFQDKKYQLAIQAYGRAINADSNDALAYYQQGVCYEMLGDSYAENAIAAYGSAIALNAKDAQAWYRRAGLRYGLRRYAAAAQDYNKVIALNSAAYRKQYNYSIYYRGKANFYLKNLSSACEDFKKAAALGVTGAKQDYDNYCSKTVTVQPDCNRVFASLKEALSVAAAVICRLDLSKEHIATIPAQLYTFKNLTQVNFGTNPVPQSQVDELQRALPACKISYTPQKETETNFGYIEMDQNGYTNAAGQQIMEKVSRLLKAQPRSKIRLSTTYTTAREQKMLTGYMNTIVNMFAKIGVNPKTQIEQQVSRDQNVRQQQQNAQLSTGKKMNIRVTGININENQNAAKKS